MINPAVSRFATYFGYFGLVCCTAIGALFVVFAVWDTLKEVEW